MEEVSRVVVGIVAGLLGASMAGALAYAIFRPRIVQLEGAREIAEAQLRQVEQSIDQVHAQAELSAKAALLAKQEEIEREVRERRAALDKFEARLTQKDEVLDERRAAVDAKESDLRAQAAQLEKRTDELKAEAQRVESELQRVAGLSREEARDLYLSRIEAEFSEFALRKAREVEARSAAELERQARHLLVSTMERTASQYITEATTAVVTLATEDMKGRIIGREGRNIRAFEQVTGTDLIIDETPEAAVISCFDPIRRETARLTLMNLMLDGRIHPGRIEEVYEQAKIEIERMIAEAGERAADRAGLVGLHPKIVDMMGRLRFRTSYAQNVLDHSVETSQIAAMLAAELGQNVEVAKLAGFLHDIGKALGEEWEGPHAITGMEFLQSLGVAEAVTHAVGAHHRDIDPESPEALLVIVADALSAARPGARRENLDAYVKRLGMLETIANSHPGVERSYALQAGREIRVVVKPEEIDDLAARRLAHDLARKIQSEMEYPGQIKVTVIRETRASDTAK